MKSSSIPLYERESCFVIWTTVRRPGWPFYPRDLVEHHGRVLACGTEALILFAPADGSGRAVHHLDAQGYRLAPGMGMTRPVVSIYCVGLESVGKGMACDRRADSTFNPLIAGVTMPDALTTVVPETISFAKTYTTPPRLEQSGVRRLAHCLGCTSRPLVLTAHPERGRRNV